MYSCRDLTPPPPLSLPILPATRVVYHHVRMANFAKHPHKLLSLLASPTRLRILCLLQASDLTVTDLQEIIGRSQPAISNQLKRLRNAGLVRAVSSGHRWLTYSLAPSTNAVTERAFKFLAAARRESGQLRRDEKRLKSKPRPAWNQ